MKSLLYKLRFTTAVHFGPPDSALSLYTSGQTFCADTLFSALCHAALSLQGPAGVEELCRWVQQGELFLSDGMPWHQDTFYLPKPMVQASTLAELPAADRKAMKKLQWLPVEALDSYAQSLAGGPAFAPRQYAVSFGGEEAFTRARVCEGEDTVPYTVGAYTFAEDCGLYFLARCGQPEQQKRLNTLLEVLGCTGMGGKVSSGYGRFTVETVTDLDAPADAQTRWFHDALTGSHPRYLVVSASLPRDDELDAALEGAHFALVRRGGFVQSPTYSSNAEQKRTQYFLASGSVVLHPFAGDLYEVGGSGSHPVYRYGRPILLGVTL